MIRNSRIASRIAESTTQQILRAERMDEFGFRTEGGQSQDIANPVNHQTMMAESVSMWQRNPLANSIIELQVDFAMGDGITFEAEDEQVGEILEEYWEDPTNDWPNKGADRFRDLSLNGELILKPEVKGIEGRGSTGKVIIHNLYPGSIKKVGMAGERIVLIEMDGQAPEAQKVIYKNDLGKMEGDLFYYQINKTSFQSRGVSDLLNIRDWLALYDKSLYTTLERVGLLMSFVWDVTIKGADGEQLRSKWKQIQANPPRPGGTRVHNENEEWKAETPELGGRDFDDIFRLLKSQIIGGSRQPEHYFGMGGDVNLATAAAMNRPYLMKVRRRQNFWKKIISDQFDYVIEKAIANNSLPAGVDTSYSINIGDPDKDAANTVSDTLVKFSNALSVLQGSGIIDMNTATSVVKMLLGQIGVEATNEVDDVQYDALAQAAKGMAKESRR